jgi:hypothetical protein
MKENPVTQNKGPKKENPVKTGKTMSRDSGFAKHNPMKTHGSKKMKEKK